MAKRDAPKTDRRALQRQSRLLSPTSSLAAYAIHRSLFTIFGGLVAIGLFQKHGRRNFFNAGKISTSHAKFADDCAQCHDRDAVTGKFTEVLRDRFVTASPSKRSIANARLAIRNTAFTKRTSFKTAPARRHRNIAGSVILDWSRLRNADLPKQLRHDDCVGRKRNAPSARCIPPTSTSPQQIVFELPRPPQVLRRHFRSSVFGEWSSFPDSEAIIGPIDAAIRSIIAESRREWQTLQYAHSRMRFQTKRNVAVKPAGGRGSSKTNLLGEIGCRWNASRGKVLFLFPADAVHYDEVVVAVAHCRSRRPV